jgi:hypothetical protein
MVVTVLAGVMRYGGSSRTWVPYRRDMDVAVVPQVHDSLMIEGLALEVTARDVYPDGQITLHVNIDRPGIHQSDLDRIFGADHGMPAANRPREADGASRMSPAR